MSNDWNRIQGLDDEGFRVGGGRQGEMRVRANAAQRGIVTSNPSAGGGGEGFCLLGFWAWANIMKHEHHMF
jgi:hypothetical protein